MGWKLFAKYWGRKTALAWTLVLSLLKNVYLNLKSKLRVVDIYKIALIVLCGFFDIRSFTQNLFLNIIYSLFTHLFKLFYSIWLKRMESSIQLKIGGSDLRVQLHLQRDILWTSRQLTLNVLSSVRTQKFPWWKCNAFQSLTIFRPTLFSTIRGERFTCIRIRSAVWCSFLCFMHETADQWNVGRVWLAECRAVFFRRSGIAAFLICESHHCPFKWYRRVLTRIL